MSKKKQNKIGKNKKLKRRTIGEVKNGEYLITYTRHLEKKIRILEKEKQLLDAERLRLEQEISRLKNEYIEKIKAPIVSNNSGNNFSKSLGKVDKKQKESPKDSTTTIDYPIEEEVDKLQEPNEILLKWYELQHIKTEQPPASNDRDYSFKIIVLGKPEKTAFIRRFTTGFFQEDIKMTTGADFSVKNVEVGGRTMTLRIWDFDTGERFKPLLAPFIKGANGAIVMYDIIDAKTLKDISEVIDLVNKIVGYIPIFLSIPELPSKAKEIVTLLKKYTFTEISNEIGPKGERVFELLTKKMLEYEYIGLL